jgi:hypothetical protein
MAYGVHIRRRVAAESQVHQITLDEWLEYVRSDSELSLKGATKLTSPKGETISWESPGLAQWKDPETGTLAGFDYWRGKVSVGNPSRRTLIKMFQIAMALGAVVQGDAGEEYDDSGIRVN